MFALLFADNLKLITPTCKASLTQADIYTLTRCQEGYLLRFKVKDFKCKVLHIGPEPIPEFLLGGYTLPYTESERDLGVETTARLIGHLNICI